MPPLEVSIVATRRSDLLRATLDSFAQGLFARFDVTRVSANIDPLWGDEAEQDRCVAAIRHVFPGAVIHTPERPGYAAAVRRLWSASTGDLLFHLEDDWALLEPVGPEALAPFADPAVLQIALWCREKNWDVAARGPYHYTKRRVRLFGRIGTPILLRRPAFTVSPSFVRGDVARRWAALMDVGLDPEKQVCNGRNPVLERELRHGKVYLHTGRESPAVIADTGRAWRERRGIVKSDVLGASVWTAPSGLREIAE